MLLRSIISLCCLAWLLAANPAFAQTVTVDKNATADGVTVFTTIQSAILSFSEPSGTNAGSAAPNVVEITSFGPYNEIIPVVSSGVTGGAVSKVGVRTTESLITVRGVGIKPLILVQYCYGFSCVIASQGQYEFDNVIMAPSDSGTRSDRYIFGLAGVGSRMTFRNCVLTCLPTAATSMAYTSINDLPAGVVDGSRAWDSTFIRNTAFRTDRGAIQNEGGPSTMTLINTVVTQFGNGTTGPAIVSRLAGCDMVIGPGCIIRNNTSGINMLAAGAKLDIQGTSTSRVLLGESDKDGNGRIAINGGASAAIIKQCNFITPTANKNMIYVAGTVPSLNISECIFADGVRGATTSTAIMMTVAPTAAAIDNLTVMNYKYALRKTMAADVTIKDSILRNYDTLCAGPSGTVTLDHCGYASDTGVLASGGVVVTPINSVAADPAFTSTTYGASGFAEATNTAYAFGASDGNHLDGGGTAIAGLPVELSEFSAN